MRRSLLSSRLDSSRCPEANLSLIHECEEAYKAEKLSSPKLEQEICEYGFYYAALIGDLRAAQDWADRLVPLGRFFYGAETYEGKRDLARHGDVQFGRRGIEQNELLKIWEKV